MSKTGLYVEDVLQDPIIPRYEKCIVYLEEEEIIGIYLKKPHYRKTIFLGNLPDGSTKLVSTGYGANDIIIDNLYGYCKYTNLANGLTLPLPYTSTIANENIKVIIVDGNISITTSTDRSGATGYLTIEYTKTTD